MKANLLHARIAKPTADLEEIADHVIKNPALLSALFAGLEMDKAKIRYGCLKVLRIVSEKAPERLYPDFDRVSALLGNRRNVLRWGAILIIGNLAAVDSENRIDRILPHYLDPITGPALITAANTIVSTAKIAEAKPHLADRIAHAILAAEVGIFPTPECKNVVLGHAVNALDHFFRHIRDTDPVITFVERQLRNRRYAVKRKAAAFLKNHRASVQPARRDIARAVNPIVRPRSSL